MRKASIASSAGRGVLDGIDLGLIPGMVAGVVWEVGVFGMLTEGFQELTEVQIAAAIISEYDVLLLLGRGERKHFCSFSSC